MNEYMLELAEDKEMGQLSTIWLEYHNSLTGTHHRIEFGNGIEPEEIADVVKQAEDIAKANQDISDYQVIGHHDRYDLTSALELVMVTTYARRGYDDMK